MARIDVIMPQMGESIAEGTLSRWMKKIGDEVKRDEPMFEISTDKVDAEIPAPSAGVLAEIKVQEGQTVPVQTVVAVIETEKGSAVATAAPAPAVPPAPAVAPVPSAVRAPAPPVPAAAGGDGAAETADDRLRRLSTPLVRRLAAEHSVDIAAIPGSGHAGRVTKQDLLGYLEAAGTGAQGHGGTVAPVPEGTTAMAAPPRAPAAPVPLLPAVSSGIEGTPWAAVPWPGDRVEPMSKIRILTAQHMVLSRRTSAHVTSFYEIDMTRIARLRDQHKAAYETRGAKLTYLGFIVKAVADLLRRHPVLNAAVQGTNVIYRQPINIGIAVALDWGLIVPVLRNADELSLFGVARNMRDLADRARTKKLKPEEVQQGTFTITNPGVFGSYVGAPIINQPQVAILGVGAVEKRPKVITLDDGTDVIAPRLQMMLGLTYDHRVVDGADADRFMADLKQQLQEFPEGAV
ncbi:MAG: dihydrolipoamide acetyltransferase family protein [Gemmatimonadota bacterium]